MEYIDALNRINSFFNRKIIYIINNIPLDGIDYHGFGLEEIDVRAILADMLVPSLFYREFHYEDYPNVDQIISDIIIGQFNRAYIAQVREDIAATNLERGIVISDLFAAEGGDNFQRIIYQLEGYTNSTQADIYQDHGDNSVLLGDAGIIFLYDQGCVR
jgi:hypothetical protein